MSSPSTDSADSRPPDVNGTTEPVRPTNEDGVVVQDRKKWLEDFERSIKPGELAQAECWWRDRQPWLQAQGYMLRPRYMPDWQPSWLGTKRSRFDCEDALLLRFASTIDAVRISDSKVVVLKKVSTSLHRHEVEISEYFSSEPLKSNPRNHCVPIYEVLRNPSDSDIAILVMPLLQLQLQPPPSTIGEAVEALRQIYEGIHFMHEHRVAHRDCMMLNIMMDPVMFPKLFHPQSPSMNRKYTGRARSYTRTEKPPKYYIIDFGLSRKYDEDTTPLELPMRGGDRTVPEFQGDGYDEESDPFPVDVYYLGNMTRMYYLNIFVNLEFLKPLIEAMTQEDPTQRPSMAEVVTRIEQIAFELGARTLRSRLCERGEGSMSRRLKDIKHTIISIGYTIRRLPPTPRPRE